MYQKYKHETMKIIRCLTQIFEYLNQQTDRYDLEDLICYVTCPKDRVTHIVNVLCI